MRILGVDPGTRYCGYGVIDTDGRESTIVDYGVIHSRDSCLATRLRAIFEGLCEVVERTRPDVASVEGAFFGKNVRTALKIGEGRGAALVGAVRYGAKVVEYSPAQVKKSVVGTGRAHKEQVQKMVAMLLNLDADSLAEDAADALALALCHAHRLSDLQ